jgi:competence protein ComEC
VKTTLAATLAAQVFTLPVLVYNFGYISTLSPLTNILIVPFLALITVAVFIFGVTAMIFPPLGYFLSWPVWLAVTYIVGIIDVFSKMPKNSIVLADVHWFWLLVSGIGLFLWTLKLNKRKKIW